MICNNCGKNIEDDSLFCEFCGTKIVKNETKKNEVDAEQNNVEQSANEKQKSATETISDIKVKDDKNVTMSFKAENEKIVEETIQNSETKDDLHDNFLLRFIKKSVGELEEGPIIKNKFVMFCVAVTVLVVFACIIIGLIYDINVARSIHDIG